MAAHRKLWHKGLQRCALLTRKLGLDIPPTHVQFSSLRREHPIWTFDAPQRVTRWASRDCCVCSHSSLLVEDAPLVVHQLVEQGPGHSAVPVRDGRPFLGAANSCSTRMARLRDGVRPCQTTSGPPLSMSQWPNSTGAQDSPEKAWLSITPAHRGTSRPRAKSTANARTLRHPRQGARRRSRGLIPPTRAARSKGTRQRKRQFLRTSGGTRQRKRRRWWLSPSDRNWLCFPDRSHSNGRS
jgi:hypothetical protein